MLFNPAINPKAATEGVKMTHSQEMILEVG